MPQGLARLTQTLQTVALVAASGCSGGRTPAPAPGSARYEDLTALFQDWRAFQRPKLIDGVPDYSATAMAAQQR